MIHLLPYSCGKMFGTHLIHSHYYLTCAFPLRPYYLATVFQITSSMDPKFDGKQCTLAHPHSNAVVDLDGDCLAGLDILSSLATQDSLLLQTFS